MKYYPLYLHCECILLIHTMYYFIVEQRVVEETSILFLRLLLISWNLHPDFLSQVVVQFTGYLSLKKSKYILVYEYLKAFKVWGLLYIYSNCQCVNRMSYTELLTCPIFFIINQHFIYSSTFVLEYCNYITSFLAIIPTLFQLILLLH